MQKNIIEKIKTTFLKAAPFVPVFSMIIYLFFTEVINFNLLITFIIFIGCGGFILNKYFTDTASIVSNQNNMYVDKRPLLEVIMDNLDDPFIIFNHNGDIIISNKAAKVMFDNMLHKTNISAILHQPNIVDAINTCLENDTPETVGFIHANPVRKNYVARIHIFNSEALPLLKGVKPSKDEKQIILSIHDITEIKKAEKMRVDFIANMSHELRTPLASITGFIETLQGPAENDPAARKRFLQIMADESGRMTRLIEDLLSLSRIEQKAHVPPQDKVKLTSLITSVIDTFDLKLQKARMTIEFVKPKKSTPITGDHDQITQVFQNLIDNAIKYGTENTTIKITVKFNKQDQAFNITVFNEGRGISKKHLARLTERFYRIDAARSRNLGSTGLGLAIVKHIIQRHHGQLKFESIYGESTTILLSFPLKLTKMSI